MHINCALFPAYVKHITEQDEQENSEARGVLCYRPLTVLILNILTLRKGASYKFQSRELLQNTI